jgi:hypothetical protein
MTNLSSPEVYFYLLAHYNELTILCWSEKINVKLMGYFLKVEMHTAMLRIDEFLSNLWIVFADLLRFCCLRQPFKKYYSH